MHQRKWALGARLLILILPALLFGQSERGTISGLVKDPSGAVVANAKVTVTNTATSSAVTINTTQSGDYTAPSLQPGTYTVRIEAGGFRPVNIAGVILNASTESWDLRDRSGAFENISAICRAWRRESRTNRLLGTRTNHFGMLGVHAQIASLYNAFVHPGRRQSGHDRISCGQSAGLCLFQILYLATAEGAQCAKSNQ